MYVQTNYQTNGMNAILEEHNKLKSGTYEIRRRHQILCDKHTAMQQQCDNATAMQQQLDKLYNK